MIKYNNMNNWNNLPIEIHTQILDFVKAHTTAHDMQEGDWMFTSKQFYTTYQSIKYNAIYINMRINSSINNSEFLDNNIINNKAFQPGLFVETVILEYLDVPSNINELEQQDKIYQLM